MLQLCLRMLLLGGAPASMPLICAAKHGRCRMADGRLAGALTLWMRGLQLQGIHARAALPSNRRYASVSLRSLHVYANVRHCEQDKLHAAKLRNISPWHEGRGTPAPGRSLSGGTAGGSWGCAVPSGPCRWS